MSETTETKIIYAAVVGWTPKRLKKFQTFLLDYGIIVAQHIESYKSTVALASKIKMLICSTNNNSHKSSTLVKEARKKGLEVIFIPDNKAKAQVLLKQQGYHKQDAASMMISYLQNKSEGLITSTQLNISSVSQLLNGGAFHPPKSEDKVLIAVSEEVDAILRKHSKAVEEVDSEETQDTCATVEVEEVLEEEAEEDDLLTLRDLGRRVGKSTRSVRMLVAQAEIDYMLQDNIVYASLKELKEYYAKPQAQSDIDYDWETTETRKALAPMIATTHIHGGMIALRDLAIKQREVCGQNCRSYRIHTIVNDLRRDFGISLKGAGQNHNAPTVATIDYEQYELAANSFDCAYFTYEDLTQMENITVMPKKQKPQTKAVGTISPEIKTEEPSLALADIITMLRKEMKKQNLLRLDITQDTVLADKVSTVALEF